MRYVALLRGINVGRANRVKMADLVAALERHGISNPTPYLQSGNVLFESGSKVKAKFSVEAALASLNLKSAVILRSAKEMQAIAKAKVFDGRSEPEKTQFVSFLQVPMKNELEAGPASEILHQTTTEIYWVATPREGKAPTGPRFPRGFEAQVTNRNWIVTRALAELLKER